MALKGQSALVVGGLGGIGLATAKELLRQGANVGICDVAALEPEIARELQSEFGALRLFCVRADVRDDVGMEGAFVALRNHFKSLDICVNSAGILNDFNWNLEVDVNLKGVIRTTLLAWKYMGKHNGGNGGTVINVASTGGLTAPSPIPVYIATKHAVVGFGRSCGEKCNLDRTGVRVITICPGGTLTQMLEPGRKSQHLSEALSEEWDQFLKTASSQTAEHVARGILHTIQHGESGSIWVVAADQPAFQVIIPPINEMRVSQ